jgi:hypothetical protein
LERPSIEGRETLERLTRWPGLHRAWTGKKVRIWSNEHGAYWRRDGAGYSSDGLEAGVFDFSDAFKRTRHCGPEKGITFRLILTRCQAGQDGECYAAGCLQLEDGEPEKTGRFCPLPTGNPIVALRESD